MNRVLEHRMPSDSLRLLANMLVGYYLYLGTLFQRHGVDASGCELPLELSQRRFFPKMRQANLLQGVGGLTQANPGALCK